MRILTVELDEFVGDASTRHAPLWTKELAIGKEHSLHVVRTYVWLSTFLEHALSTPRQPDSNPLQWDEFAKYVSRIKVRLVEPASRLCITDTGCRRTASS